SVASSGANLAPGATGNGSTAILNAGSLTLASGSNFSLDLRGAVAGTTYDQLRVTGAVSITGSNLVLNSVSGLSVGQTLFIVDNNGTGAITGTFSGLANGATFTSGGDTFTINYLANDGDGKGHDISLTVDNVSAGANTGSTGTTSTTANSPTLSSTTSGTTSTTVSAHTVTTPGITGPTSTTVKPPTR